MLAAKNSVIKQNICQRAPHELSAQSSSRHVNSVSFGGAKADRISSNPGDKSLEKEGKFIKTEAKKIISTDTIFNYSNSNYNSSNIIKMLRVKQEVHRDPRLGLSKEQLLTRLITMEQEYKNLKHTFETRRNQQFLSNKQIKDYKDLIEISESNIADFQDKITELNTVIQNLCRTNYSAVDLYKEVMDLAKERNKFNQLGGGQELVYSIIGRIEYFLSNSNLDISQYDHLVQENRDYVDQWEETKKQLTQLKENLSSIIPEADNKSFQSPSNFSLAQSKSHSRIVSSFIDETRCVNKDFTTWKESLLTKNPSFTSCTDNQRGKSRNFGQNTLSSKTLIETDRYNSSRHVKDQSSINQFDRKVFMTAEHQKRKLDATEDIFSEQRAKDEIERCKSTIMSFLRDYDLVCNEIVNIKELNPKIHIKNSVFEIWTQNSQKYLFEDTIYYLDQIISAHTDEFQKIERLLEDLSVMILSNQRNGNIDKGAWDLIQKIFGDKILVKILKHIDTMKRDVSASNRGNSKNSSTKINKSLMALRKWMMQLEMNVNSRDQFLIDEAEHEATQNLFVKALSMVDKLIMGNKQSNNSKSCSQTKVNESSTNKSNSEWDTKSMLGDKTIFEIDSKSGILPDFGLSKKDNYEKGDDAETIQSLCNIKRSISVGERSKKSNNNSLTKWDQQLNFIENLEWATFQCERPNKMQDVDYLNLLHMQASHLEDMILYVEDVNAELDKQNHK